MKSVVFILVVFLSIANLGYGQNVSGKKLIKAATQLEKEGKNREAIELINSNFTKNGKYQNQVTLQLASIQVNSMLLDSAKNTLSLIKDQELGKLSKEFQKINEKVRIGKEQYEIAIALAKKSVQSKNYDKANLAYNDALKFDIGNYKAWFGLAEVQSLKLQHQEAVKLYKITSKKYYTDPQELVHTFEHLAEEYIAIRDPYKAIQVCEEAELINKMDPMITFLKGKAMFYQRDFDIAIGVLSSAILLDKSFADGYFYRGSCYHETKKYENAIKDFTKVISYKTMVQESYSQRAKCYFDLKQYDNAENDFKELEKLEEQHFHAVNAVGICQFYQQKYDLASVSFTKAIDFVGKDSTTISIEFYQYNLAMANYKNNKFDESLRLLNLLASNNSSNPVYNIMYTQVLIDNENYKEAGSWVEKSMLVNPSVKEYYELSIKIANILGDTDKAADLGFRKSRVHGVNYNLDLKF